MGDIIKMDYGAMEDMSQIFKRAADQLDEIKKNMGKIADEFDGGVLIGDTGTAFSSTLRDDLCAAIERLSRKMRELNGDIYRAMADLRGEDEEVVSHFND